MTRPNNDHFRQYLYKNSLEEKDLKATLSKIDEAKYDKLSEFRRRKYSFVARHSRHMSSESPREICRIKPAEKEPDNSSVKKLKKEINYKQAWQNGVRKLQGTKIAAMLSQRYECEGQGSDDFLKLHPLSERKSRSKMEKVNLSPEERCKHDDKLLDKNLLQDKKMFKETGGAVAGPRSIQRYNSESNVKDMNFPVSKIHLFRQLSHRVSKMSTWYYLLRDVFERLSREEGQNENDRNNGKSIQELYEELKTCRYLRMPTTLHRITPTYSSFDSTE